MYNVLNKYNTRPNFGLKGQFHEVFESVFSFDMFPRAGPWLAYERHFEFFENSRRY